ncbi:MAG: lysophospholipid acyltransferase family protein [Legionellaceae bacterium]|nr:lysophospholipid acyltransferase family protein [Legionellaceae bacterium]
MNPMRTIRRGWITCISFLYTGYICAYLMLQGWRKREPGVWVDDFLQNWGQTLLRWLGTKCTVVNPKNICPKLGRPTIIMCNHSSMYDIPISFLVFPKSSLRMLAKRELSRVPFLGGAIRAAGFPMIDRKNREQAIRDLAEVRKLMEQGSVIWMAPEGTRAKDGRLGSFKKGGFVLAIQTQAVIIPIGIRGASDILPTHTFLVQENKPVEVHVGAPIDASEYTLQMRAQLLEKVREEMLVLTGEK